VLAIVMVALFQPEHPFLGEAIMDPFHQCLFNGNCGVKAFGSIFGWFIFLSKNHCAQNQKKQNQSQGVIHRFVISVF